MRLLFELVRMKFRSPVRAFVLKILCWLSGIYRYNRIHSSSRRDGRQKNHYADRYFGKKKKSRARFTPSIRKWYSRRILYFQLLHWHKMPRDWQFSLQQRSLAKKFTNVQLTRKAKRKRTGYRFPRACWNITRVAQLIDIRCYRNKPIIFYALFFMHSLA